MIAIEGRFAAPATSRMPATHHDAIYSTKFMGLRRKRGEFRNAKRDLYQRMQAAGFGQHWVDVVSAYSRSLEHPPTADLLSRRVQVRPFPGSKHTPNEWLDDDSMVGTCARGMTTRSVASGRSRSVGDDLGSLAGCAPRAWRRRSGERDDHDAIAHGLPFGRRAHTGKDGKCVIT